MRLLNSIIVAVLLLTPAAWGKIDTVRARDFIFVPNSLTIRAGDTVVWKVTEACCAPHTSTRFASPMSWNSGNLTLNQTFRLPFPDTGTFSYTCSFHGPGMSGTIKVLQPPPPVEAMGWLGLFLLGASLTAAGIWILERKRKPLNFC